MEIIHRWHTYKYNIFYSSEKYTPKYQIVQ